MNWHQPEKLRLKRCWKGQISYLKNVPKVLNMFAGVRQKEVGDGQSPNAGNITAAHNKSSEPTRESFVALCGEFLGCAARLKR